MKKAILLGITVLSILTLFGCSLGSNESSKPKGHENTAVTADLTTGTWEVGKDIKPGTYIITSLGGHVKVQTNDDGINAILTDNATEVGDRYISSVRAVIVDGHELKISGLSGAHFEATKFLNNISSGTLNAGTYVIGKDIKPGVYTISFKKGSGKIMTDDGAVIEMLGDGTDGANVTSAHVRLKKGQKLTTTPESVSLTH